MIRLYGIVAGLLFMASPVAAQSAEKVCGFDTAEEAAAEVNEVTLRLKIANFRADVPYMDEMRLSLLNVLNQCEADDQGLPQQDKTNLRLAELGQACSFDCFAQLGQFYLFMAGDFKFLSSAGSLASAGTEQFAEEAAELADQGRTWVETGLKIVARQQQGAGETPDDANASFRSYLRQVNLLQILKIQLTMIKGDVWYQSLSNVAVTNLAQNASASINPTTAELGSSCDESSEDKLGCALGFAMAHYEDAFWSLIEAETDIPAGAAFDDLRINLNNVRDLLSRRTDSVRNGHLFLNIDPDAYTNLSFKQLSEILRPIISKLVTLDRDIQSHVTRWKAELKNNSFREYDESRIRSQDDMALSAHKIAKIESASQIVLQEIKQKQTEANAALDTTTNALEANRAVKRLEFDLQSTLKRLEREKSQIEARTSRDLLTLSKSAHTQRQSNLRWLINLEITEMNLDLQQISLDAQIVEYERQEANNKVKEDSLKRQKSQKLAQIEIENGELEVFNLQEQSLLTSQNAVYESQRESLKFEACRLESELAFLGSVPGADTLVPLSIPVNPPGEPEKILSCNNSGSTAVAGNRRALWEDVCATGGLREELLNRQIEGLVYWGKCISADPSQFSGFPSVPCSTINSNVQTISGKTAEQLVVEMLEQEESLAADHIANLENFKDEVQSNFNELKDRINFLEKLENIEQAIAAAETIAVATAGQSITLGTIASPTGGAIAYATRDLGKPAAFVVSSLERLYRFRRDKAQDDVQEQQLKNDLDQSILDLEIKIGEATDQEAIENMRRNETLIQLGYRLEQNKAQIDELMFQKRTSAAECKTDEFSLLTEANRYIYQHQSIVSQIQGSLKKQRFEDAKFRIELDIIKQRKIQAQSRIEILNLQIADIEAELESLEQDFERIGELKTKVAEKKGIVTSTQTNVGGLVEEQNREQRIIDHLLDDERKQIIALEDSELEHLSEVISDQQTFTEELIDAEKTIRDTMAKKIDVNFQGQIESNAVLTSIQSTIDAERDSILNVAQEQFDTDVAGQKETLFLATEEELTQLFPGVPDYLDSKKKLFATSNFILNLIRSRYRKISGLASEGFDNGVVQGEIGTGAYITKVQQVVDLDQRWTEANLLNEAPINVEKPIITIEANSAFSQELLREGRVTFQISPRASGGTYEETVERMRDLGFLTVWDPTFDNGNPRLIDAMVKANFGVNCADVESPNFSLIHKGFGFIYPVSEEGADVLELPGLEIGPELAASQAFLRYSNMTRYLNKKAIWDASPKVNTFDSDNVGSDAARYLGLPLAATYELILHQHKCEYQGDGLQLFLAVATDTPE